MNAQKMISAIDETDPVARTGRIRKVLPTFLEADGPSCALGALCQVETLDSQAGGGDPIVAEVVGVRADAVVLAPFSENARTFFGAEVRALPRGDGVPAGDALLGRVVDALGRPADGGKLSADEFVSLDPHRTSPLDRITPRRVLETGVRAVDGLLTLGKGQRVGVFAPSGAGKTSLMTQFANQIDADRCVICLVGERGREVESLWADGLSESAKARTTVVAATSDQSAALRVRAGWYALALADHWRRQGHDVLLLLDSVTRLAMAMREIGLAAGEPPTVRAYTPGVFSAMPKLVEGCGALRNGGSITAVMTVLCETDDVDDPIAEMMKSLLDGHIILSRELAGQGHFPAIHVPSSLSRLAGHIVDGEHLSLAGQGLGILSAYDSARVLIESGVYVAGGNPDIDRAIELRPRLMSFLAQKLNERSLFQSTRDGLSDLLKEAVQ